MLPDFHYLCRTLTSSQVRAYDQTRACPSLLATFCSHQYISYSSLFQLRDFVELTCGFCGAGPLAVAKLVPIMVVMEVEAVLAAAMTAVTPSTVSSLPTSARQPALLVRSSLCHLFHLLVSARSSRCLMPSFGCRLLRHRHHVNVIALAYMPCSKVIL